MSKEPESFRTELEQIMAFSGGRRLLKQCEVAAYLGRSVDYVREHMNVSRDGMSATALAMYLAKLNG